MVWVFFSIGALTWLPDWITIVNAQEFGEINGGNLISYILICSWLAHTCASTNGILIRTDKLSWMDQLSWLLNGIQIGMNQFSWMCNWATGYTALKLRWGGGGGGGGGGMITLALERR